MISDEVRAIARGAATKMEEAGEVGIRLGVEKAFVAESSRQLSDPVAIGGLIVSIASLAWTIFKDYRTMKGLQGDLTQLKDELAQGVREELENQTDLQDETRRRLIDAVVEATLMENTRM